MCLDFANIIYLIFAETENFQIRSSLQKVILCDFPAVFETHQMFLLAASTPAIVIHIFQGRFQTICITETLWLRYLCFELYVCPVRPVFKTLKIVAISTLYYIAYAETFWADRHTSVFDVRRTFDPEIVALTFCKRIIPHLN